MGLAIILGFVCQVHGYGHICAIVCVCLYKYRGMYKLLSSYELKAENRKLLLKDSKYLKQVKVNTKSQASRNITVWKIDAVNRISVLHWYSPGTLLME